MKPKPRLLDISWIDLDPPAGEIQGEVGREYIPIGLIEMKLKRLDPHWSTCNFKWVLQTWYGTGFASGSLEVLVTYSGKERRLTGAATLPFPEDINPADPDANFNFTATVKAECIKNAVKAIGKAFGAGLNERDIIPISTADRLKLSSRRPQAAEMKPDKKAQEDFNDAVEAGDENKKKLLKVIYPSLVYTRDASKRKQNA